MKLFGAFKRRSQPPSESGAASADEEPIRYRLPPPSDHVPETEQVRRLVAQLGDADITVRMGASRSLVGHGLAALQPLLAALDDENEVVRGMAALTIGELGDAARLSRLPEIAAATKGGGNEQALMQLMDLDQWRDRHWRDFKSAQTPLDAALENDPSWFVREKAAQAIGMLGFGDYEVLLPALHDESEFVRASAAKALGMVCDGRCSGGIGDRVIREKSEVALLAALHDEDGGVRAAAAEALGTLGDARAVGPLTEALDDGNSLVVMSATESLVRLSGLGAR